MTASLLAQLRLPFTSSAAPVTTTITSTNASSCSSSSSRPELLPSFVQPGEPPRPPPAPRPPPPEITPQPITSATRPSDRTPRAPASTINTTSASSFSSDQPLPPPANCSTKFPTQTLASSTPSSDPTPNPTNGIKPSSCSRAFPNPIPSLSPSPSNPAPISASSAEGLIIKTPCASLDKFVGAALIELYSKCGVMGDVVEVFDGFMNPDDVLWTSVVTGFQRNGYADEAVKFFSLMVVENAVIPDPVTVISLVVAIGQLGNLRAVKCCHGYVIRVRLVLNLSLMNLFLNLYSKLGAVWSAEKMFEEMHGRVVLTLIILAYFNVCFHSD